MMSDEARKRFPGSDDLPSGVLLYALYAADGRALALTDSQGAAFGHAIGEDLKIASVH